MSFKSKTLDELHELALAHLRGRVPAASLAPGSDYWLRSRAVAAVTFLLQQPILDELDEILPSKASPAFLPEHAAVRMGAESALLPAAPARGLVMITGTVPGIGLLVGATLTHANGSRYKVTTAAVMTEPAWSAKTVAVGSRGDRVLVAEGASDIALGDIMSVGADEVVRAVRDRIPDVGTPYGVDLYTPVETLEVGTAVSPLIGAVVELEAVVAGSAGNLLAGDTLTIDSPPSPPPDMAATATVLEMTGGGDEETPEQLRARILAWMAERPGSGNRSDYREWVRATPGVRLDDACIYFGYRGVGTIDIVPIGVSGARQTGDVANAKILTYLGTQASMHDDVQVRQLIDGATAEVYVTISTGTDFISDWDGAYEIDVGSTTSRIMLTDTNVAIPLGARVLIQVTTGLLPATYQRTVTARGIGYIDIDTPLPSAPAATYPVLPGGPTTQSVLDAIYGLFDRLGPGDPDGAHRWPDGADAWEWILRPEQISHAVLDVEGIDGADVTLPAANVTPAQFARVRPGVVSIVHAVGSTPATVV